MADVHGWRMRREQFGELVQWDTCTHDVGTFNATVGRLVSGSSAIRKLSTWAVTHKHWQKPRV